ncbi:hypothetical protein DIS24_g1375 [Lasiodiplodia hormozganensis]|uniref:Uncharacterized protein n=1 Tax=Lasiodiplodia hormozganensis TaxID=869390 RepID=A0AA39Z3H1_9PEZI|nr:hypothetical protein DIS24_g1375 [Lasiodiplodia hormozganensis]
MSACTYDVVALTTMVIWMTLSGTALSSSIHVFSRAFVGLLVFFAVDMQLLEPLTADNCVAHRSLRLSFCLVGLFGLLAAHFVVPVLRRIRRLAAFLPPSQQQQMPGAWPWFAPSPSPSRPSSPALTEVNQDWEADHLAKMASLPADCFISPEDLAARGKRAYTCPSYDDDSSAHGPAPSTAAQPVSLPSAPALVEKEEKKEEKEEKKEQEKEEEEEEDRVPWTHDGLLDLPSNYGIRARFSAAARADAALLAARVPGSRNDETESEVADVERMGDSASLHHVISGTSSLSLLSSRRCQHQPDRPRRRHISSFAVPRVVVKSPPRVRPAVTTALASPVLQLFFPLSRPLKKKKNKSHEKKNKSRKWKARRLLTPRVL